MIPRVQEQRALVHGTGGSLILAGVAFGLLRFFGEVPPGQDLEAAAGATAFGTVIAAPGVLALLATRGRPALLVPAALLLIPLSFLSFALVTLPLLVPAFLLLRAHQRSAPTGSTLRTAAVTSAVLTLLVAAVVALFTYEDPREHATASVSYATSDIVTYGEAVLSLALSGSAVLSGWVLGRPGGPGARRLDARSSLRGPEVLPLVSLSVFGLLAGHRLGGAALGPGALAVLAGVALGAVLTGSLHSLFRLYAR